MIAAVNLEFGMLIKLLITFSFLGVRSIIHTNLSTLDVYGLLSFVLGNIVFVWLTYDSCKMIHYIYTF